MVGARNETNCENVTLTEFDQNQMLADIKLNDSPAILSFCNSGDCVCKPGEDDPGCKRLGFKAGVILKN